MTGMVADGYDGVLYSLSGSIAMMIINHARVFVSIYSKEHNVSSVMHIHVYVTSLSHSVSIILYVEM